MKFPHIFIAYFKNEGSIVGFNKEAGHEKGIRDEKKYTKEFYARSIYRD